MSILIEHGYIVTVDTTRRVILDGWVFIVEDVISAIGSHETDLAPSADQRIDARGNLVMPGLVNGHNHHWASLFKNTGEGMLLEEWRDKIPRMLTPVVTAEDRRIAAYLGAIEQIRTGTTTSLNHLTNINDDETMAATIDPVIDVGIRQLIAKELRDTPNPSFSPSHPAIPHIRDRQDEIAYAEQLVERWDGAGGVVHMGLAMETGASWMLQNTTSNELILDGLELAKKRNLKISNHCSAGTPWLSIKEFAEVTGGGDVDYLVQLGAMADNWVFVHALHLQPQEIDAVAISGASIITNPVSNAYSCDGIAPLKEMFAAGINVGLGTDGTYVNCSPDMVQQMKFAVLIQNVTHYDPTLMTAERAIEMATIDSAKALGLDHLIGSLETGKKADIVIFNLNKAHTVVVNRPIASLVFSANGTDVETVLVNGRIIMHEGKLNTNFDENDVLVEATARASAAIERAGLSNHVMQHWRT